MRDRKPCDTNCRKASIEVANHPEFTAFYVYFCCCCCCSLSFDATLLYNIVSDIVSRVCPYHRALFRSLSLVLPFAHRVCRQANKLPTRCDLWLLVRTHRTSQHLFTIKIRSYQSPETPRWWWRSNRFNMYVVCIYKLCRTNIGQLGIVDIRFSFSFYF